MKLEFIATIIAAVFSLVLWALMERTGRRQAVADLEAERRRAESQRRKKRAVKKIKQEIKDDGLGVTRKRYSKRR